MNDVMSGIFSGILGGGNAAQTEAIREQLAAQSVVAHIMGGLISAVLLIIFSTIGGLLGIPIFEKRKGSIPPPPPQSY